VTRTHALSRHALDAATALAVAVARTRNYRRARKAQELLAERGRWWWLLSSMFSSFSYTQLCSLIQSECSLIVIISVVRCDEIQIKHYKRVGSLFE